ncbi:MAG TPA: permease prefix domain 1-containing protein, partial [Blastocatellia bacterium]|nr:permease prefix domain 1-containing protein [Blastocatellia bacterium]
MTSWLAEFVRRLRALFRKEALDRDLDDEMAAHLDFSIEENIRQGFGPEEARRRALIRFGGQQHAREQHRDARGLPMLEVLMQDMRYAARTFRRERSFTLIAISILALGIGANTAVFSVVNRILLRPLPFRDSQRLCWLTVGN